MNVPTKLRSSSRLAGAAIACANGARGRVGAGSRHRGPSGEKATVANLMMMMMAMMMTMLPTTTSRMLMATLTVMRMRTVVVCALYSERQALHHPLQ